MRDENRRVWEQLSAEKRKVDKLVGVVGKLWDIVGKGFAPGAGMYPPHCLLFISRLLITEDTVPPFPVELFDAMDSPNIYITSPPEQPQQQHSHQHQQSMHYPMLSPGVSPTTPEFSTSSSHPSSSSSQPTSAHPRNYGGWRADWDHDDADTSGGRTGNGKRQRLSEEYHAPQPPSPSSLNGPSSSASSMNGVASSPLTPNGDSPKRGRSDSAGWSGNGGGSRPRSLSLSSGGGIALPGNPPMVR